MWRERTRQRDLFVFAFGFAFYIRSRWFRVSSSLQKTMRLDFRYSIRNSLLAGSSGGWFFLPLQTCRRRAKKKKWWLHIKIQRTHQTVYFTHSLTLSLSGSFAFSLAVAIPHYRNRIWERGDRTEWKRKTEGMKNGIQQEKHTKMNGMNEWKRKTKGESAHITFFCCRQRHTSHNSAAR